MSLRKIALGITAGLVTTATCAMAAEEGAPAQPPQTHDIRSAELPPVPGLYFGLTYGNRKVRNMNDNNGDPIFPDTSLMQNVFGLAALYVKPQKVYDGTLAFYGLTAWQNVKGNPGGPLPAVNENGQWVDAIFAAIWSKAHYRMPDGPPMGPPPGYAYAFGLQTTLPGGEGSLGSLVISPNTAFTYRTDPILLHGTEFSNRLSYNHVTERDSRIIPGFDYKDGDYIVLDAALTERYKNFQFGAVSTYMKQIEDDVAGAGYPGPVNGRMEELVIGGLLNIDHGMTSALKMRFTKGIRARNMAEGNFFSIQFIKKL